MRSVDCDYYDCGDCELMGGDCNDYPWCNGVEKEEDDD